MKESIDFFTQQKIGNGDDFLKNFSNIKISAFLIVWKRKFAHLCKKKKKAFVPEVLL